MASDQLDNSKTTFQLETFSKEENAYDILNSSRYNDLDQIRQEYFKLSLSCHPDKVRDDPNSEKKFQRINWAYEILSDEKSKRTHDAWIDSGLRIPYQQFANLQESQRNIHWNNSTKIKPISYPQPEPEVDPIILFRNYQI